MSTILEEKIERFLTSCDIKGKIGEQMLNDLFQDYTKQVISEALVKSDVYFETGKANDVLILKSQFLKNLKDKGIIIE